MGQAQGVGASTQFQLPCPQARGCPEPGTRCVHGEPGSQRLRQQDSLAMNVRASLGRDSTGRLGGGWGAGTAPAQQGGLPGGGLGGTLAAGQRRCALCVPLPWGATPAGTAGTERPAGPKADVAQPLSLLLTRRRSGCLWKQGFRGPARKRGRLPGVLLARGRALASAWLSWGTGLLLGPPSLLSFTVGAQPAVWAGTGSGRRGGRGAPRGPGRQVSEGVGASVSRWSPSARLARPSPEDSASRGTAPLPEPGTSS